MNFQLGPNAEWIQCGFCGMRSFNRNDVEQKFCGNCHRFLEEQYDRKDPTETPA